MKFFRQYHSLSATKEVPGCATWGLLFAFQLEAQQNDWEDKVCAYVNLFDDM